MQQGNDSIDFFHQSLRWIANWNSGHCTMIFYHFLEQRLVDMLVVTVTSVFSHCNICIGNLAFAIPACMYFVPNY